jgi:hypothetical protein
MEHIENEMIRKKIESVDALPEEYASSIDSKFELLMTGITESKKQSSRKYLLIPLGLVGCFLMMIWFKPNPIVLKNPNNVLTQQKSKASNQIFQKNYTDVNANKNSLKLPMEQQVPDTHKSNTPLNNALLSTSDIEIVNEMPPTQKSFDKDSTPAVFVSENIIKNTTDSSLIVNVPTVKLKAKRHRYVEIDFNNNNKPDYEIVKKQTKTEPLFTFKLIHYGNITSSALPAIPLRLQKDF